MRVIHSLLHALAASASLVAFNSQAQGFNPNAGADPINAAAEYEQPARYLPAHIVPSRYYVPSATPLASLAAAPQPAVISPLPAQAPVYATAPAFVAAAPNYAEPSAQVATIAPLPEIREVPADQPALSATPAAGYVQSTDSHSLSQPANRARTVSSNGKKSNRFSLGIEGYYDDYREDSVDLKDQGYFGSLTASYEHYFNPNWYGAIEARGSRGSVDYESISGTIDGISQWEAEGRLLVGYEQPYPMGDRIKVYTGLGSRYFSDELKDKVSTLGFSGYDRRITQFYVPLGVTYEFQAYGLQFSPNFEYNQLIYGHVQSRLQNIPGFQELNNTQTKGYGLRGEFLVGTIAADGRGWQAGPFIRYWDMDDSDVDVTPSFSGLEPQNTRLQIGATLKWLF